MIWGEHAEKYPELLKEEAKYLLFTLGNHTYHHKDLTKLSINADVLSYLNRPTIIWSLDTKKLGSS